MMKPRFSMENYQWNMAKSRGKNKVLPIVQTFHNKKNIFDLFDALRQQLIDYKCLINQYYLKNHQNWVTDVFAVLVNIDDIIIKYEITKEPSNKFVITVWDRLQEEADMLDDISDMPISQSPELNDDVDAQIENQYLQVREAIYAVHTALLEAIPKP